MAEKTHRFYLVEGNGERVGYLADSKNVSVIPLRGYALVDVSKKDSGEVHRKGDKVQLLEPSESLDSHTVGELMEIVKVTELTRFEVEHVINTYVRDGLRYVENESRIRSEVRQRIKEIERKRDHVLSKLKFSDLESYVADALRNRIDRK